MTKDTLKQLIREMVQEEVRNTLPELLPQIMAEVFASKSSRPVERTQSVITPKSKPSPPVAPVKKEYKIYTKNEALNKVLNETVGGVPQEGSLVSSGMGQGNVSVMDHIDKVPNSIANALTKDYSSLLKTIDKKRSSGVSNSGVAGMM